MADRPMDQRRGHRGVDTSGQTTDHPRFADPLTDQLHLLVDHRRHRPVPGDRRTFVQEPGQHGHPVGRVDDLRVELHPVDPPVVVLEHGDRRTGRRGCDGEAVRSVGDAVEVTHPDVVDVRRVGGQQQRFPGAGQLRSAVLTGHSAPDRAAELLRDQLSAVADSERRDPEVEDVGIE